MGRDLPAEPGLDGLRHRVVVGTEAGTLVLRGEFRHGYPWRYDPVLRDGVALAGGEQGADDCWERANARSIGLALRAIRGEVSVAEALALGAFTPDKARVIDDCVRAAFG